MNGTTTVGQGQANANTGNFFPWAGQPDETACNYAFGLLVRNLPARVAIENKMHGPTLMAAAGAVAGVCAQVSLLSDVARIQKAREDKKISEVLFKPDGRIFLFGEALNEMLFSVSDPEVARSRVWNMMVSAALQKGMSREAMPNVPAMFRHVSESLGTPKEGRPSVADNAQPVMAVRDLLQLVGPVSFAALAGEMQPTPNLEQPIRANRKSWVGISAQMAANMLLTVSKIMPPELALQIGMESAIYASRMRANHPEKPAEEAAAESQA